MLLLFLNWMRSVPAACRTPHVFDVLCASLPGITDRTNKNSFMYKQADYCSPAGTPKQCNYPADAKNATGLCSEVRMSDWLRCQTMSILTRHTTMNLQIGSAIGSAAVRPAGHANCA